MSTKNGCRPSGTRDRLHLLLQQSQENRTSSGCLIPGDSIINPDAKRVSAGFGVCTAGFQSCFDSVLPAVVPLLPLEVEMHVLHHCILKYYNLFFY